MGRPKRKKYLLPYRSLPKGRISVPTYPFGNETVSRNFPQSSARLSKANLDICIFSVNLCLWLIASATFPRQTDAGFVGKSAHLGLLEEMGTIRHLWLAANFPQMNFTQMHERLRQELLRRIQRGTLSVSLLARQTGLGQPHISNFLRSKRQLSLRALDKVLACQRLSPADLLPTLAYTEPQAEEETGAVPIVSYAAALFEPFIRAGAHEMLRVPARKLEPMRSRAPGPRRAWQRFVAVRIDEVDALPMDPLVLPGAIALIDRHYSSFVPYWPARRTLYAIRQESRLTLRYAEFLAGRLVLRPHNLAFPVELIEVDSGASPHDLLAGRVGLIVNET